MSLKKKVQKNPKWNDTPCTNKLPFICKYTTPRPPPTPAPPTLSPPCKATWRLFAPTNACYKAIGRMTWNAARGVCKADGGFLVSIHSKAEHDFVVGGLHESTSCNIPLLQVWLRKPTLNGHAIVNISPEWTLKIIRIPFGLMVPQWITKTFGMVNLTTS